MYELMKNTLSVPDIWLCTGGGGLPDHRTLGGSTKVDDSEHSLKFHCFESLKGRQLPLISQVSASVIYHVCICISMQTQFRQCPIHSYVMHSEDIFLQE